MNMKLFTNCKRWNLTWLLHWAAPVVNLPLVNGERHRRWWQNWALCAATYTTGRICWRKKFLNSYGAFLNSSRDWKLSQSNKHFKKHKKQNWALCAATLPHTPQGAFVEERFFQTHMAPPPQTLPPKGLETCKPPIEIWAKATKQKEQWAMVLQFPLDGSNDQNQFCNRKKREF